MFDKTQVLKKIEISKNQIAYLNSTIQRLQNDAKKFKLDLKEEEAKLESLRDELKMLS